MLTGALGQGAGQQRRSGGRMQPDAGDASMTLADGRHLAWRTFGAPDGLPLIALHGTPGSRLKFEVADPLARAAGLRVIAPDRWGYGGSSPHPSASLRAFADDVQALADRLGLERFSVLGVSGGGPYATGVAAAMPDRVAALALAAPVGPIAGEPDSEITAFHKLCFGPIAQTPAAVGAVFQAFRAVLDVSPDVGMRMAMVRVARADRRVLKQREVAARLGQTFIEGLRPGVSGPVTDLGIFGAPWDLDPGAAHVPARLWLGSTDNNVPRSAARRLAARLPRCEFVELAGEGHLWIANNYATVLGWIAATHGGRRD